MEPKQASHEGLQTPRPPLRWSASEIRRRSTPRGTWRQRTCSGSWAVLMATGLAVQVALGASSQAVLPPLTAGSSPRLPGKFVWADLVTDNVAAAQAFYGKLLGWTFHPFGDYLIAANDERPLCGMFQRPKPPGQTEAKPRWFGYISVPNVDRARKAVVEGGGRVLAEPGKFPKRGEQAIFADSEGALFGVIKSSSGDPEDFLAEPGDWIWVQLVSRRGPQAAAFYKSVAGYEVVENADTNRLSDFVLTSKGYARATVRTLAADLEKVKPTWLLFVRVKSVKETVAQAKQLGGSVPIEPRPELLDGKVAVVADPTGAALGVMEWPQDRVKGAP